MARIRVNNIVVQDPNSWIESLKHELEAHFEKGDDRVDFALPGSSSLRVLVSRIHDHVEITGHGMRGHKQLRVPQWGELRAAIEVARRFGKSCVMYRQIGEPKVRYIGECDKCHGPTRDLHEMLCEWCTEMRAMLVVEFNREYVGDLEMQARIEYADWIATQLMEIQQNLQKELERRAGR